MLFIAKMLIVKNEWTDIYNLISYDLRLLKALENRELSRIISLEKYNFPKITNRYLDRWSDSKTEPKINLDEEAFNFFRFTRNIRTDYPEKYFRFKPYPCQLSTKLRLSFQDLLNYLEKNEQSMHDLTSAFERELELFYMP